jgi:hypothetical protein
MSVHTELGHLVKKRNRSNPPGYRAHNYEAIAEGAADEKDWCDRTIPPFELGEPEMPVDRTTSTHVEVRAAGYVNYYPRESEEE